MPATTQVDIEVKTFRGWAAKRPEAVGYLREVELAPCASSAPEACLLRGTRELPWGRDPGAAIRTLVMDEEPASWPTTSTVRPFDFKGPVALIDDVAAETELLSTQVSSPIWDDLRGLAGGRRLGAIELSQMKRLMVPIFAFTESGARVDWARGPESVFLTALAFPSSTSEGEVEAEDAW